MTGYDEREVRDLLLRAADEFPAATVLPEPLLTEGRRAIRRRRLVAGVAAVVTVLALFGATALLDAARPAPRPAPPANRPPAEVPERFDPAQWLFRLDGIPDDLPLRTYSTDDRTQGVTLTRMRPSPEGNWLVVDREVTVSIAARGVDIFAPLRGSETGDQPPPFTGGPPRPTADVPRPPSQPPLPGDRVAPVLGVPAYLHTSWERDETRLSWQYAPDAWATVSVRGDERPEETARRFAAALVWQPYRVTMPFLDVDPPAGARLNSTVVTVDHGRWTEAQVSYLAPSRGKASYFYRDLIIGVSREPGSRPVKADTTIAGRPAWVNEALGEYRVGQLPGTCPTCVAEVAHQTNAGRLALGSRDAALALAATVRLVDAPDDVAAWRPL
ncbi:hypothetical protein [Micromonospora echinaurantiaca]|uniref:hypothetical protein n=1 Tax=Micromonospora echinaurantiaca TaxID=47857 RepID=UPI0034413AA9